jgi:hypothetical protein
MLKSFELDPENQLLLPYFIPYVLCFAGFLYAVTLIRDGIREIDRR